MQPAPRPCVTAGVALVVGGLFAAAPVLKPLPDLQTRNMRLTAAWQEVLDAQLGSNSSLINGFLGANGQLVDTQQQQTPDIATLLGADVHADGSVHGLAEDAVEQFFDANNAITGANQAALLGLLGARGTMDAGGFTPFDLSALNESLLVDPQHAGSIPFAGLESAVGHYVGAAVFLQGALSGASDDEVEGSSAGESFSKLLTDVGNFNDAVLAAEKTFNTDLVGNEIDLEQAMFGTDSAYNGVINRAFNAFNMMYDAQQQSFNGSLGLTGYDPQAYTDALLAGTGDQVFNDGSAGGLLGMSDQNLAALTNLGGLLQGDGEPWTGDGFQPNPDHVADAFQALMTTMSGGMFGDVFSAGGAFSVLLTDLQNLFTGALGSWSASPGGGH